MLPLSARNELGENAPDRVSAGCRYAKVHEKGKDGCPADFESASESPNFLKDFRPVIR